MKYVFFPFCGLALHSVNCFFCCTEDFRFHQEANKFNTVAGHKNKNTKKVPFLYNNESYWWEINCESNYTYNYYKNLKSNQGYKRLLQWKLQNSDERSWREHKTLERSPMLMDWNN